MVKGGFTNVMHVVRATQKRRYVQRWLGLVWADLYCAWRAQEGGYSAWVARKLPGDWDA